MEINKLDLEKYKLEDFDTTEPYKDLELIDDTFLRQSEEQRLEEYAKKLGYKHFKRMLAAYRKQLKGCSIVTAAAGGVTDFEGQDAELRLASWNADETGIWRKGRDGLREYACSHPIYPCELRKNIDTGEIKVKLKYRRSYEMKWSSQIVDYDTIANAKNIVTLAKYGISVTSGSRAQALVDYLREITDMNHAAIERVKTVSYLGWNSEGFAPYTGDVEFDGDPGYVKVFDALSKPEGNLEKWIEEAEKCRAYHVVAHIVIAASLAACLIKPLGISPFFVHLWSMGSGTGKSVACMAAASVWGNPEIGDKYFKTLKTTDVGVELLAGFLHSIPVFLDELQHAKEKNGKKDFDVYSLASGAGKLRGTKNLGIASSRTWRTCFITTGETPIVGASDGAGALNRVIEVECFEKDKVVEDGHAAAVFFSENYGFAGRCFIHKLTEEGNIQYARTLYEKYYSQCNSNKTTEKQAMAAAAILTADKLATEWIFSDKPLTSSQMAEFLKSAESVSLSARGYDYMCDWVATNFNHFTCGENAVLEHGEIFGSIEGDTAYIIRSVFDRICADAGINAKALLSNLKEKGLIHIRGDGKGYTVLRVVSAGAPKTQCVALVVARDNDNVDYSDIDF